ncbi:Nin-like protein [Candidatus Kaiserbacteria bacterium]|nr:Nin-like protein [Candidatus Kaiserbacteria bacterium]
MNAYRIEPPFYVSFSGGRTSAYLLRHILDAWGGTMPADGLVLFANTGKEHEATLEFVREIERNWCPVTWLEWQDAQPTQTFRVVSFETASRNGEPFEALIKRRKFLPNPVARFCTSELKVNTMQRYLRSIGYKVSEVSAVLGLRYDEMRRVVKLRADPTRNIDMPLATMRVVRADVEAWWGQQEFDLRLPNNDPAFGNCDCCFLKSRDRIDRVLLAEPHRAEWWDRMEQMCGATFRKDRPPYQTMLTQVTVQGRLFLDLDDDTMPCDCTD